MNETANLADSTVSKKTHQQNQNVSRPRFQIFHLLHATAVVAAAIALFGPWGITWALLVFAFWLFYHFDVQGKELAKARAANQQRYDPAPDSIVLNSQSKSGFTWIELLVVLAIIGILIGMMLPAVSRSGHVGKRTQHLNNFRQISLAILNYESAYGHFPPAYIADENGNPMHSWRVLILPFLEGNHVYEKYDFDEPWDGPNNSKLADQFDQYSDASIGIGSNNELLTSAKFITGPRTAFIKDQTTLFNDVKAGLSRTILLVDDSTRPIHWMSPYDVSIDEAIEIFDTKTPDTDSRWTETKFSRTTYDFKSIAFMDGSIDTGGILEDPSVVRQFMTIVETPTMEFHDIDFDWTGPVQTPKAEGYILLAINIALALMPGFWIGKKRTSSLED